MRVVAQSLTLILLGSLVAVQYRSMGVFFGFSPPVSRAELPLVSSPLAVRGQVISTRAKGIGSPFAGKVRSLHVKVGQPIQRGQLLFEMDVASLRKQLEQARSEVRRAKAEVGRAQHEKVVILNQWQRPPFGVTPGLPGVNQESRVQHWSPLPIERPSRQSAASALLVEQLPGQDGTTLRSVENAEAQLAAAITRKHQAVRKVERLVRLIRDAKRYSPIDGVVTSVRTSESAWTAASKPVVRVDDPRGYRVVALVRNRSGAVPRPGHVVPIRWSERNVTARVDKTVPGWDREALYTWVWLLPKEETELIPGQVVEVHLSDATASNPMLVPGA